MFMRYVILQTVAKVIYNRFLISMDFYADKIKVKEIKFYQVATRWYAHFGIFGEALSYCNLQFSVAKIQVTKWQLSVSLQVI